MTRLLFVSTLSAILSPAVVFGALDASWIQGVVQRAQEGSGEVIIQQSSSVSTGGQTAGSGESVVTDSASASSKIETHIESTSESGEVRIKIETEKNGVTQTQEYEKVLAPGERFEITQGTSSVAPAVKPQVKGAAKERGATVAASSSASTSPALPNQPATDESIEEPRKLVDNLREIPRLFKRIFSFFWWL